MGLRLSGMLFVSLWGACSAPGLSGPDQQASGDYLPSSVSSEAQEGSADAGSLPDAGPAPGGEPEQPALLTTGKRDGREVNFLEVEPGVLMVVESGEIGQVPLVGPIGTRRLSDIYRSLTDAEIPQALLSADQRRALREGPLQQESSPMAPTRLVLEAEQAPGIVLYDTNDQTWFRNTFCNGAFSCIQGFDWARTENIKARDITFVGMVGREGVNNVTLWSQFWRCTERRYEGCPDCGCWWDTLRMSLVVPGHWLSVGGTATNQWWYRAMLQYAGANTQLSLATVINRY